MTRNRPSKVLVVGASRGIGLGLTRKLATRGCDVVASFRSQRPDAGIAQWLALDINDARSRARFVESERLSGLRQIVLSAGAMPKDVDLTLDPAAISNVFHTNAVSPVILAQELLERHRRTVEHIVFLGSIMGSIGLNEVGDHWIYRASKAALTSAARSFAVRNPDVLVTVVHPGWVKTDMGGEDAEIDVETSVNGLAEIILARPAQPPFVYCDYLGQVLRY